MSVSGRVGNVAGVASPIVFGGPIASVAAFVVPFMAVGYVVLALLVVFANAAQLPEILGLVFRSAFGMDAALGGIISLAVMWGVKRRVYSNEAGQGTGPHAAAAAEVPHPAKNGLIQAFAVHIDTLW